MGVCKQSKTEIANVIIGGMMTRRRTRILVTMMMTMMTMMTVIKGKWASVNRGCGDRNSKHELSPHCNTQYTSVHHLHLHLFAGFVADNIQMMMIMILMKMMMTPITLARFEDNLLMDRAGWANSYPEDMMHLNPPSSKSLDGSILP